MVQFQRLVLDSVNDQTVLSFVHSCHSELSLVILSGSEESDALGYEILRCRSE